MDAKEVFMNPMAHILPGGVHRVKKFIQDLVQLDQREGEESHSCEMHVTPCEMHVTPCVMHVTPCEMHVTPCEMHVLCFNRDYACTANKK